MQGASLHYWVQPCTDSESRCQPGDPELAQWALATMWMGCAVLGVQYNVRRMGAPPFQLAYWGLIFPNVYIFFLPILPSLIITTNRVYMRT